MAPSSAGCGRRSERLTPRRRSPRRPVPDPRAPYSPQRRTLPGPIGSFSWATTTGRQRASQAARPRSPVAMVSNDRSPGRSSCMPRPGCRPNGRCSGCRSTACRGRRRAPRWARRRPAAATSGCRAGTSRRCSIRRSRPRSTRSRTSPSSRSPTARPGGRSTSTHRKASDRSWASPTASASRAQGSGRSATSAACPGTRP